MLEVDLAEDNGLLVPTGDGLIDLLVVHIARRLVLFALVSFENRRLKVDVNVMGRPDRENAVPRTLLAPPGSIYCQNDPPG